MKRRLFLLHSWLGLIAALGLLIIGLTGSFLVFREEIDAVWSPDKIVVAPQAEGRLPYDELLTKVKSAFPGYVISGWSVATRPDRSDLFYMVKENTNQWVFVTANPYTGTVLTEPTSSRSTFTGWILELHYSFFADHAGLLIAGLIAVLLCLLGITGIWLYRGFWKTLFTLRWDRSLRIFFSDAHKLVGITTVVFNLILGFTGAWWNLSHLIGHLVEEEHEEDPIITRTYQAENFSVDKALTAADAKLPGYRAGYISFPTKPEDNVMFWGRVEPLGALQGPYGSVGTIDKDTSEIKDLTDIRQAGLWAQILDSFTPLHFGTFGGLPVKILWCLGGLAPGILGVTGFLMWRLRRQPKSRTRTAPVGQDLGNALAE